MLKFLFHNADLINFYLEDHNKDTLISAKELKITFKVFDLFDKKINVSEVLLDNAVVHIHRDSLGKTNITEVFKAFSSNKANADTTKSKFTWNIDLSDLNLNKTDFHYLDDKTRTNVKVLLLSLAVDMNSVSFDKK